MAYTQTDLSKVESAIIALAAGERVVSVMTNGKNIQYGPAQIEDLEKLRDTIKVELGTTSTTKRYILTSTSKGL